MGTTSYCSTTRSLRAETLGYHTKSIGQIFEQSKTQMAHESMLPSNVKIRECRDSVNHPNTVPICLFLDETGSMDTIPHEFIKDGLPTLMETLIENGVPDAAVLFAGIGDHLSDNYPLQVGQFESGDAENDLWLSRLYLEGKGGGNGGESYPLAWQFVANYTVTDSWEKRKKKGFLFTIGDERPHKNYQKSFNISLYKENAKQESTNNTLEEFLRDAQKTYHVYHLHYCHDARSDDQLKDWQDILGENCIKVDNYRDIPKLIAKIILSNETISVSNNKEVNNVIVEDISNTIPDNKKKKPKML